MQALNATFSPIMLSLLVS